MGEGSLSKWACLPLLTSCLEGVGTMVVKAEGGVEEAALPRPGVVGPLALLELLLLESLDSDNELLELLSEDEDRLWHCFSLFAFLLRL